MTIVLQHFAETFMFWTLRTKVGEHKSDVIEKLTEIAGIDLSTIIEFLF